MGPAVFALEKLDICMKCDIGVIYEGVLVLIEGTEGTPPSVVQWVTGPLLWVLRQGLGHAGDCGEAELVGSVL